MFYAISTNPSHFLFLLSASSFIYRVYVFVLFHLFLELLFCIFFWSSGITYMSRPPWTVVLYFDVSLDCLLRTLYCPFCFTNYSSQISHCIYNWLVFYTRRPRFTCHKHTHLIPIVNIHCNIFSAWKITFHFNRSICFGKFHKSLQSFYYISSHMGRECMKKLFTSCIHYSCVYSFI